MACGERARETSEPKSVTCGRCKRTAAYADLKRTTRAAMGSIEGGGDPAALPTHVRKALERLVDDAELWLSFVYETTNPPKGSQLLQAAEVVRNHFGVMKDIGQ